MQEILKASLDLMKKQKEDWRLAMMREQFIYYALEIENILVNLNFLKTFYMGLKFCYYKNKEKGKMEINKS